MEILTDGLDPTHECRETCQGATTSGHRRLAAGTHARTVGMAARGPGAGGIRAGGVRREPLELSHVRPSDTDPISAKWLDT